MFGKPNQTLTTLLESDANRLIQAPTCSILALSPKSAENRRGSVEIAVCGVVF